MKNLFLIVALSASTVCVSAFGANGKTRVDIQINSMFKDSNIIFVVQNPISGAPEEVGLHKSNAVLFSQQYVAPIRSDIALPVEAYVTDTLTNRTAHYISLSKYQFKPNSPIPLSFPIMFMEQ